MTSTNSSSKFFKTLKNNFRRHGIVFVVFQIISLLLVIGCLTDVTSYDFEYSGSATELFGIDFIRFFSIVSVFESFIFVSLIFRGFFSKRASDLLFSLPVKRGTWFNAAFVFGFIEIVLSYAVAAVISICYFKFNLSDKFPNLSFETAQFVKLFVLSFLAVVIFYAVFMMCACVSGRMWQYVFLSFISTAVFCIGACGFICYLNTVYGIWINLRNSYFVSPVGLVLNEIQQNVIPQLYIASAIQLAAAYTAGYFAFKKRKAEVAENSLSGKILPFALSLICFLSEILVCLSIVEISAKIKLVAGIVSALITAVILSAIFFRKVFSKKIGVSLAAAVALSAVLVFSVQVVAEKTFVYYVPESSEVESVKVYSYGELGSPSIIDFLYGSNYITLNEDDEYLQPNTYEFKTDTGKEKVNLLHIKCLEDETRNSLNLTKYNNQGSNTLKLEYTLKNGKRVIRTYTVSSYTIYKEFSALLQTDEGIGQVIGLNMDTNSVLFAEMGFKLKDTVRYQGKAISLDSVFLDSKNIDSIFECIKKDTQNANPMNFTVDYANFYLQSYYNMKVGNQVFIDFYTYSNEITEQEKAKLDGMTAQEMLDYNTNYINDIKNDHSLIESYSYSVFYDDENTISYLEKMGYTFN